jgi:hypothetical protein
LRIDCARGKNPEVVWVTRPEIGEREERKKRQRERRKSKFKGARGKDAADATKAEVNVKDLRFTLRT